jgi:hypothetical protein
MIAFNLDQQLLAATHNIDRHMEQQQPDAVDPGCAQPFGKHQAADAVEQFVGDQTRLEQSVIGPEIIGANALGGINIFDLFDHLLDHGPSDLQTPDVLGTDALVCNHNIVAAFEHIKQR